MIATIIIISLAFYWLVHETDWLRVNLCLWYELGASCEWRLGDDQVDDHMKGELLIAWRLDKIKQALFSRDFMQPLFGWGYAYQFRDVKPEYKIELVDGTSKVTINSNSIPHLKDAFKVWRNPYIKIKLRA